MRNLKSLLVVTRIASISASMRLIYNFRSSIAGMPRRHFTQTRMSTEKFVDSIFETVTIVSEVVAWRKRILEYCRCVARVRRGGSLDVSRGGICGFVRGICGISADRHARGDVGRRQKERKKKRKAEVVVIIARQRSRSLKERTIHSHTFTFDGERLMRSVRSKSNIGKVITART